MKAFVEPHRLFVAGNPLADCPEREILVRAGFTSNGSLTGVGFLWTADGLIVVLPKAYSSCGAPASVDRVFLLLRLLKRVQLRDQARKEKGTQIRVGNSPYPEEWALGRLVSPSLEALLSAIRDLYRDFSANGLYLRRRSAQVRNDFRYPVDWRQTLSASLPRLEHHGIEFAETRHRGRAFDFRHPIRQLQSEALRRAAVLLGEGDPVPDEPTLDVELGHRLVRNRPALFRELCGDTFDERTRNLLDALQRFYDRAGELEGSSNHEPDGAALWTPDFENIWEMLVREKLAPHESPSIPKGAWGTLDLAGDNGIGPKVDGFYHTNGLGILVDAKDKRDKGPEDGNRLARLGSAADHYKQVMYKQLAPGIPAPHIDYNLLIFPTVGVVSKSSGTSELLRLRGRHYWPGKVDSLVHEIEADFETLARAWLGETRLSISDSWLPLITQLKNWAPPATSHSIGT